MRKRFFNYLLASAFLMLSGINAMAQKTIYVLSDLHVMAPELLINDGSAWQAFLSESRKMVDYSQPIFDALVNKIETAHPDLVLITGDLTKDGEVLSHDYVVKGLQRWKAAGIPTLVIPGNHDFGTNKSFYYDGDKQTDAEVLDLDGYKEKYDGFGYFDHESPAQKPFSDLSYWQEPIDGLIVIGLDSHTGSISESDVEEACRRIKWARHDGYEVIVMMHHSLIPHFYKEDSFKKDILVEDHEEIKEKLVEAGAHIVISGHFHTSDIARDYNSDMSKSIVDISTGSTISYPCDYRILTYDPETKDIKVATESVTTLESVENFPDVAKERLFESSKKLASDYITRLINETAPSLSGISSLFLPQWSNGLANALVLFAEGNEAEADETIKQSILSDLSLPMSLVPELKSMLSSLLEDKTPYDPEGSAPNMNITDDRTLDLPYQYVSIKMGTPSMATLLLHDPEVPSAATLYYSDANLVVPENLQVYTLKMGELGEKKTVEKSQVYAAGKVIPAGTAVIVQSVITPSSYCQETSLGLEEMLSLRKELGIPNPQRTTFMKTVQDGVGDENNLLLGFDKASMTVGPDNGGQYKYYKLCWDKPDGSNEEALGFYYSESDGGPFVSGAHKAYLAIPVDAAAAYYTFDDLTGIKEIPSMSSTKKGTYTIGGVRISDNTPLPSGIYITGGKKKMVR